MYKLQGEGVLHLPTGIQIPFDKGNRHYVQYLEWIGAGNSPEPDTIGTSVSAISARQLRNDELARADVMLNRVQDGEKGIGTQKAWREYRIALRQWPDTEDFPATPPVAPL